MNLKTKRVICFLVGAISVLTIISSVSYAYFSAMSDTKPIQSVINTATVSAIFRDGDSGISEELSFGRSITKKFTIENTGTAEARVKMFWNKLVNTYLAQSLTYTLSYAETEEGPYTEIIAKTNVPQSTNPSKKILAQDLSIPVDKTYYYNLVVTLNYLEDVNQDSDLDAVFYTDFTLEDINQKLQVTFDAGDGLVDISKKTLTENEKYGALPVPTRAGYIFKGWYTDAVGGMLITEDTLVTQNDSFTVYARWTNKVNVTIHLNAADPKYLCYAPYFPGYDKEIQEITVEATIGETYEFLNDVAIDMYSTGNGCDGCISRSGWLLDGASLGLQTRVTKMHDHDIYVNWSSSTIC